MRSEAGGGFGGLVMPIGAYVVNGDRVRWVPAVNATVIVLAGLATIRLLALLRGPVQVGVNPAETKNIETRNTELPGYGDQMILSSVSASSYRSNISSRPVRYRS